MASKAVASTALLLTLNLLFFTMVSSTYVPCPPPPHKKTPPSPKAPSTPKTPPSPKAPSVPKTPPSPKTPSVPKTPPSPKTPSVPTTPTPAPVTPSPSPSSQSKCPSDTLKLGVCGNLLSGLVNVVVGGSADRSSCCGLIQGLADLDAAVCLCTAIKANVLGINLNVPISLSLLLNACDKSLPSGFQCS